MAHTYNVLPIEVRYTSEFKEFKFLAKCHLCVLSYVCALYVHFFLFLFAIMFVCIVSNIWYKLFNLLIKPGLCLNKIHTLYANPMSLYK